MSGAPATTRSDALLCAALRRVDRLLAAAVARAHRDGELALQRLASILEALRVEHAAADDEAAAGVALPPLVDEPCALPAVELIAAEDFGPWRSVVTGAGR